MVEFMASVDWGLQVFRIFLLAAGAAFGSFLAATAWRLPRDRSLFTPSQCVHCGTRIPAGALLPVVGWLLTKGRCSSCGGRVSPHYAVVEAVTAVLTLATFEILGPTSYVLADVTSWVAGPLGTPLGRLRHDYVWDLGISLWLLYTGVVLSLIDWEFRILPDVITLPGILIGFLVSWGDPSRGWLFSLAGVLSGAGSLWLIAVAYRSLRGRDGMGLGDVKYLGMIGAVLGWSGVLWTMMMASLVGSVAGLAFGLWSRMRSNESGGTPTAALQVAIPFGPFLAAAAFAYSLFSDYFLGFLGAAP